MTRDQRSLQKTVLTGVLYLDAKIQGVVVGLLAGLSIFIATNWLVLKGGEQVGPHLALLGQFFPGYEVSFLGSLIGLAYGFVLGFVAGYAIAWLYNMIAHLGEVRR